MKCKVTTITQPEDWLRAFKRQAKRNKMSLSAWMGQCCLNELPKTVAKRLSERNPAHRPSNSSTL